MTAQHHSVKIMWENYLKAKKEKDNEEPNEKECASWHFCNNEKDANELAELVLKGIKRATASLYDGYAFEDQSIPEVGNHSIITNWEGVGQCIIKTIKIDVVAFKDVTAEFAKTEGEGDQSLDYWRRGHWKFFSEEKKMMNEEPTEDMLVVCEEFEIVYK
ncbi:protein of unknown function DUF984 [Alkaliphilus metalliredigens QYMF]|uniref:ASCH domain-containing protein n=1 Tax=Alkaliphilus metalliredigens (strain QYMF) TaxID=293826 RepID=A6TNT9_ALKMQ|nr:ASCH domain-containing protein [Alkaliphilus metalliredigens]ABR47857.1 protein of unknown function DUF984 [Alkaliphilus metalliredigens QYMF]